MLQLHKGNYSPSFRNYLDSFLPIFSLKEEGRKLIFLFFSPFLLPPIPCAFLWPARRKRLPRGSPFLETCEVGLGTALGKLPSRQVSCMGPLLVSCTLLLCEAGAVLKWWVQSRCRLPFTPFEGLCSIMHLFLPASVFNVIFKKTCCSERRFFSWFYLLFLFCISYIHGMSNR